MIDLVVIGGGITGLGIAQLAARQGVSTVLLEKGDLASGTSSASSHLLHGGLRYLEHGRFGLVRQSLTERAALLRLAPALVRSSRFLVPLYKESRVPRWKLRAGLRLYDFLAGKTNLGSRSYVEAREALTLEPGLAQEGLLGAGIYSDAVMDDAQLAIAVARDAAAHGARICTYTEVSAARRSANGGVEVIAQDLIRGAEERIQARVVVNATGPWSDRVRARLRAGIEPKEPEPQPLLRPSRGVHLIFPALTTGHGLLLFAHSDGRVFFLVPFGEHTLVGTTEVEVESPPSEEAFLPTVAELAYLQAELDRFLPGRPSGDPIAVTSGLRPLLRSTANVGRASREHRVVDDGVLVNVAGGKYTTFRIMARETVGCVLSKLGCTLKPEVDRKLDPTLDLESNRKEPAAGPSGSDPDWGKLAALAIDHQFACRLEDVLRRRTHLWLSPDRGRSAIASLVPAMAARLEWSPERTHEEISRYETMIQTEEDLLRRL